jgi:hypothetical protein
MTEKSIAQELLRLENPIIAAVGLTRGLHLARSTASTTATIAAH